LIACSPPCTAASTPHGVRPPSYGCSVTQPPRTPDITELLDNSIVHIQTMPHRAATSP
jgi:hypothetical protein